VADVVLAALSGSATRVPVLGFSKLLARMFDATPRALHVSESLGSAAVSELVLEERGDPRSVEGDPVTQIVRAANGPSVKAVVVGSHRAPSGRGPGFITRQLATRLRQPLLVVPPTASVPASLQRVLFPLEGSAATTAPIRALLEELVFDPETGLVVMHSYTSEDAPRFADHEPYDTEERVRAFAPHLPAGFAGGVVFRAGPPERTVPEEVATQEGTVTVVTWSQVLAPGRAPLVTRLLSDLTGPILLVPAHYGTFVRSVDLRTEPERANEGKRHDAQTSS
jgi:hypothetical protein